MRYFAAAALAVTALATATPVFAQATTQSATASADARLKALYDAEWQWRTKELALDPDGEREGSDRLPNVDAASQARRAAYWGNALAELNKIPFDQLSPEERINAEVFKTALEEFALEQKYREFEDPFGFWTWIAPRGGLSGAQAYRNYIKRLGDMPRYIDEQIVNMRAGLKRGFTKPRVSLAGRDAPIAPLADPNVDKNPLFTSFAAIPAIFPKASAPPSSPRAAPRLRRQRPLSPSSARSCATNISPTRASRSRGRRCPTARPIMPRKYANIRRST